MSTNPPPSRRRYSPDKKSHWLPMQDEERLTYQQVSQRSGVPLQTIASWRRQLRQQGGSGRGFVELRTGRATW
jgi:transposase-like protein